MMYAYVLYIHVHRCVHVHMWVCRHLCTYDQPVALSLCMWQCIGWSLVLLTYLCVTTIFLTIDRAGGEDGQTAGQASDL